ncbi:adenosine deaminase [Subtercola frigoramans]|uniref:Adenosine deaminase n=1 Tax=Subtercola frigoramans TaxID=120298 RepID=A0ABS2L4W0_9MICO|nr:adenosine deaminase [Subtercola frigoramans]MBM7472135.1 adenosine deaminase [Subtercola frigoramans]
MISFTDYLRLLPKAELHCHFVSVMRPGRLVELAAKNDVLLKSTDVDELLDYDNLVDFLDVFNAAHEVLVSPDDFATVAYEGVLDAVEAGNLRYREYYVNPFNFLSRGISYETLIDSISQGLAQAETDFGVGFRLIPAINRSHSAQSAVELVELVSAHPHEKVVGIGMDDLTPEGLEEPLRFREAYELAGRRGLKRTAHAGETMAASAQNVIDAIETLGCDRVDHGYRIVDDPALLRRALDSGVPFACTPLSTRVLSGWAFDDQHRIARMVRAGLPVSLSTDDAVFFRTDIGLEYTAALPSMGFAASDASQIALTGFDAAWCSPEEKARLLADAAAGIRALDAALDNPALHTPAKEPTK